MGFVTHSAAFIVGTWFGIVIMALMAAGRDD